MSIGLHCSILYAVYCILCPVSSIWWWMWALGIELLPPPDWIAWILGVSDETLEFIEIPSNLQYLPESSEWLPETSKKQQNGVQSGSWNHQNHENNENAESHENHYIYYAFARLGRH